MARDTLIEEFWSIIESLKRVSQAPPSTYQKLADGYEIAGVVDVFKKYFLAGDRRHLEDAMRRVERVCERQDQPTRIWARKVLPRLRTIAETMSPGERAATFRSEILVDTKVGANELREVAQECDLLVLAALHDPELTSFLDRMTSVRNNLETTGTFIHGATYYTGLLHDSEHPNAQKLNVVAVFQSRPGMTDCAVMTTSAIKCFKPRLVAMTGVAAGRERMGVRLNDLLIPSAIITYDTGKHAELGFQREPLWTEVSDRIVQRVRSRGGQTLQTLVDRIKAVAESPSEIPRIHTDVMACGSAVVDQAGMIDDIASTNRKIVGVDMESYAFLRAARLADARLPAFVVKGVMDLGSNKSDQAKDRAAFWAASFLAVFVSAEFRMLVSEK